MTKERFCDERDYEDGGPFDEGYHWDPDEDLPDGSIPLDELPTVEESLRRYAALPAGPKWDWRFD